MRQWGKNGKRPMGWWLYEAAEWGLPPRHRGLAHERSILYELSDALGVEERAELEREWRREFDRSWDEHFFFCAGPDKIFSGDAARWQHWLWADLPPPFLDKFMAERRRRGRVVCELEEEGAPAEATADTGKRVA